MLKNLSKLFAYLWKIKQKCATQLHTDKLHIMYSAQHNITLVSFKSKVNNFRMCVQNCQTNLKKPYTLFIICYLLCNSFGPSITHPDLQIKIL